MFLLECDVKSGMLDSEQENRVQSQLLCWLIIMGNRNTYIRVYRKTFFFCKSSFQAIVAFFVIENHESGGPG